MSLFLFFLLFLASYTNACDRCLHQAKVAYFTKASLLSSGACGYGSLAMDFSGGALAAAVPNHYKNGAGCGACFQIRCKHTKLCTKQGTQVTVTDLNHNNPIDFVLSSSAFMAMAKNGIGQDMLRLGIVDVEYKRVACGYKNGNLCIRVEETSKRQRYLAIKFLNQGGQTEIVAVDVAQVGSTKWSWMIRANGSIWSASSVPEGALQFRMVITSGYDGKWVWARNVVLDNWSNGVIYDSGIQINDIAQEGCAPWDDEIWK
ncbi:expansin-like A1 [Cornus florida]|uniref:expansin-like A1 n=1 Tax=Cornus florida TaxID=4283 RepID=UPI00289F282E|nr:expansin-like A1 [Cornus florida]